MMPCKNDGMRRSRSLTLNLVLVLVLSTVSSVRAAGDVTLPEKTRISLQLNNHLSTKANNEGDSFSAMVTVPVYFGDRIVIPKGSTVSGSISRITRPGRFKGKAVMNLLFQSITIPGRAPLSIVASPARVNDEGTGGVRAEGTIEGEGSGRRDMGRVLTPGIVGAGVGGIAGGGQGAGIGAGVGAAIGLATVFATRGKDLELRRGSTMDISLDRPLTLPQDSEGISAKK
jgi:hypothetical protein